MFPDPVLVAAIPLDMEEIEGPTGIVCSYCHKEIRGKVHNHNSRSYDSYCWNLRFILGIGDEEKQKKEELRAFLSSLIEQEK